MLMSYKVVDEKQTCERCGDPPDINYQKKEYYLFEYKKDFAEYGEKETMLVCGDCDWEIMNGRGDLDADPYDIYMDRAEEEYAYDPINNDPPWM